MSVLRAAARAAVLAAVLAVAFSVTVTARADDSADEADLQFQLGAEAYQRGDFRVALQHFLSSNRLVPNRNVIFNIALSYEKLGSFPEAFRYYTQALEGETNDAAVKKIGAALDQLRSKVAVLGITTDPPGATLYVDRRDLGPRGSSPRSLGLPAGKYTIIAELAGYEPATFVVPDARVGSETKVALTLKPILGTVRIGASDTGATVSVDSSSAPVACRIPCELPLPPGVHTLYVAREGYRTGEYRLDVAAHQTQALAVRLDALTGSLVLSTDEPGALVEIDARPRGFTPVILSIPVGEHTVRISMKGFRSIERKVIIRQDAEQRIEAVLAQSEEVVAASRSAETVDNAPSSVTIVPRQEISRLAYPTLASAGRGVPGFYTWDDRAYTTLGVRGLGRLGSYGNRLLVLIDGQPTNDDWLYSSYTGYDVLTDLGDVERIEFVRGPGSVLYGTGAFSGVINVVTRNADHGTGGDVGVGTELDGVAKARARADVQFSKNSGVWTSVSAARSDGRSFYFPELIDPVNTPNFDGNVRGADGFQAAGVLGRYYYKDWTVQWFAHVHDKHVPTGAFDTIPNDPRTRQVDTRFYVEARGEPELVPGLKLLSRLHVNHYRFDGGYAHTDANGGFEKDTFRGSWVGLEERLTWSPSPRVRVMAGGEGQLHFQVDQQVTYAGVESLNGCGLDPAQHKSCTYQLGAGYLVADGALSEAVRFSIGARLDAYSTFGSSLNPRAALIFKPYPAGNTKIIAGKAFRAPSIYELWYNDGGETQVPGHNYDLQPESIYSLEVEHAHEFSPTVVGLLAGYTNYASGLITTREDPLFHYVNSATPVVVLGGEAQLKREWRQGWMASASYGFAFARFLESEGVSDLFALRHDSSQGHVANAPRHLATFKGAVPILSRALTLGSRLSFEGSRYDAFEAGPEPQGNTDPAVLWDVVLSGEESRFGLHWAIGVYNAFDWRNRSPVSLELPERTVEQDGRTFLASADVAF